jgi:hypothetical protein
MVCPGRGEGTGADRPARRRLKLPEAPGARQAVHRDPKPFPDSPCLTKARRRRTAARPRLDTDFERAMMRLPLASLLLSILVTTSGAQNTATTENGAARTRVSTSSTSATAMRATTPPAIDGRDTDEVWTRAVAISDFRQFDPVEDGAPAMRTEARIAYDARNLYVLVRAFDPAPDSIRALLSRRDVRTPSDWIKLVVDSYYDRRTGYEFAVNPVGVQRDFYVFNDSEEDVSWDGVWESGARIDSLGWVAEFRIPLSQLRFPPRDSHTFGIGIWRDIGRTSERIAWPAYRRSQFGLISQIGSVDGLQGLGRPGRLELRPYAVESVKNRPSGGESVHSSEFSMGADIKYGLTSNLTVDAALNPDFGQVEADPAVLNLSAFEQFFEERRPFFTEGTGIFRYDMSCNDGRCTGLFYSRRIGRTPQLGWRYEGDDEVPSATTILGAAKLTGRVGRGTSVGVLTTVTQREEVGGITVEPQASYAVARLYQDLRGGQSGVGVMLTGVNRQLDDQTEAYLRREAYTGGLDFRHRFLKGGYQVSGYLAGSTVRGSEEAIAATQLSAVHNFQRPDDGIVYDSTRTALGGSAFQLGLNKITGRVRMWTGYTRSSPGFEINDLGFQTSVDNQSYSTWLGFLHNEPRGPFRRFQLNVNQWNNWTTEGTRTSLGGNVNANGEFLNMWGFYGGYGLDGTVTCVQCTRGGPALKRSPRRQWWAGFNGDPRAMLTPYFNLSGGEGDDGNSRRFSFSPSVQGRFSSRFTASIGGSWSRNVDDLQYFARFGVFEVDTTHYTLAHLEQTTSSLTARIDFTMTPTLSLQFYANPFVSTGRFRDVRELDDPMSDDYDARLRPYDTGSSPGGFNVKQFRSNTVLRWEYRPGSTMFLVWQQGRQQDGIDEGDFRFARDYRNLFKAHPQNTVLLKVSYWLAM